MNRFFNTAGPCNSEDHYMLSPVARLPELRRLIQEKQYFVIHAARQTGKTTMVRALAEELRAEGGVALHVSLESSRHTPALAEVEPRWLRAIFLAARLHLPEALRPDAPEAIVAETGNRLFEQLQTWAMRVHPRPIVLFLDEVDTIEGPAMVSFLAQLRAGFNDRPRGFPASIALVGMRDLRDYLTEAKGGIPPNPGSPFNINSDSLALRNFTQEEVGELYAQHTAATGQVFTSEAVERAYYWTRGQPFLVNALAYHLTRRAPLPLDQRVGAEEIEGARRHLARSRTTHLSNLEQRLHEPRVAKIMQPVLLGDSFFEGNLNREDIDYCVDLGLLRRGEMGLELATPLYREVLTRALAANYHDSLPAPWWRWQTASGGLDFPALMAEFFPWWREHGDLLRERGDANWTEAAAHLILMAFMQRVVNGGGEITREFATGRGATDLLVTYKGERFAVELKRVRSARDKLETVRKKGEEQLVRYLDTMGLNEGWLVIFDQHEELTWEQRLWTAEEEREGKRLHILGG
ncbi:MAG: ATP-binding protein [Deltaproteobacteria bacterium]|nr:ATP-binding protein [Deltaproteobacteria bacterium]